MKKIIKTDYTKILLSSTLLIMAGCSSSEGVDGGDDGGTGGTEGGTGESVTPTGEYNVLLLMVDDLNNWTGGGGYYPESITPNIDKLGRAGVQFQSGFCASPVSNPSRNALWSGFRPATSGIDSNSGGYIRNATGFKNITTMNQHFLNNGYYTYGIGKLYHNGSMTGDEVDIANWSEVDGRSTGSQGAGTTVAEYTNSAWDDMTYKIGANSMTESNCNDYSVALAVASLINGYSASANASKPFFIGCGLFRPHLPWNVSNQFWSQYENSDLDIPVGYLEDDLDDISSYNNTAPHEQVVNDEEWSNSIRAYLSCVTMTDQNVGTIIDALDASPYKDNTIVILVGDHGWQLGEKKKWGKNTVYNAANRTTFIIRHPDVSNSNYLCEIPVSLQDIYPTLINLCELSTNYFVEGNDISHLIANPQDTSWDKPVLGSYDGTNYVQDSEYKYIESGTNSQLYNVKDDPYEFNNLYGVAGYSSTTTKYQEMLQDMLDDCDDTRMALGLSKLWN